jgi:FAD/FMN-containing dehydrogenase
MISDIAPSLALRLTDLGIAFLDAKNPGYERDRRAWNGRFDCRPLCIAYPENAREVSQLVSLARDGKIPLTVRGAGHSVTGACVSDHALVVDTSRMKSIAVAPDGMSATAEPGLTVAEFIAAISMKNRIVTFGSHKSIGLGGFTLSAGVGLLMSRYGLLSDNLLRAEVVLADGSIVETSAAERPDLLWAIRGGGGNFGIVTSLTYRVFPIEPTIAGALVFPVAQAEDGLRFYREFTRDLPDSLSVFAVMATPPSGVPVFTLLCCYTGPLDEGERLLAPLKSYGQPLLSTLAPIPPAAILEFLAGADPAGNQYAYDTRFLSALSDEAIRQIVRFGTERSSPRSVVVIYDFHGQARRYPLAHSSFPVRNMPYCLGAYASWPAGVESAPHLAWLRAFIEESHAFTSGTGPIGLSNAAGEAEVRAAYRDQYPKLQQIKTRYDPENLFRHNYNIPPLQPS